MKKITEKIKKYWKWGIILGFLATAGMGIYIAHFELRDPVLDMYFFNLERGRSVFLVTPQGKTILIDGGQNTQVLRELTKVLPFYRRRIDTVIITNSLPKNTGGLIEVVRRYEIGKIVKPEIVGTSTALLALEEEIEKKNLPVEKLKKGDRFAIDEVDFSVLFPDPFFKYNKTSRPELILKISYGKNSILLLGDVSKTIQKSLVPLMDRVDIIEYAHSAGDSRTSGDLFEKTYPKFVVIQKQIRAPSSRVPKNPPKKPPFNIEKQEGTELVNLKTDGSVKFVLDGKVVKRE